MANTVLVLRTADKNGRSHGGFQWPTSGPVECPDWNPRKECGNGLHGLLWGQGDPGHMSGDFDALWQVVEVVRDTIVDLDGKVKFPRGTVVYSGDRQGALQMILQSQQKLAEIRAVAETGDGGAVATKVAGAHSSTAGNGAHSSTAGYGAHSSTAGYGAHSSTAGNGAHSSTAGYGAHSSTAGDGAHSSTAGYGAHSSTAGKWAHSSTAGYGAHSSTAGYGAHSSTAGDGAHSSTAGKWAHSSTAGDGAHSSTAGYGAHSSTAGENSIASALGLNSRVKAGNKGVLVAGYWDAKHERVRVLTGYIGEDGLKADTWYEVHVPARGKAKWKVVK